MRFSNNFTICIESRWCAILINWLIVGILSSLLFASCSPPSSVRSLSYNKQLKNKADAKEDKNHKEIIDENPKEQFDFTPVAGMNEDELEQQLNKFEQNIKSKENRIDPDTKVAYNEPQVVERKIPTLREQMQNFTQKQEQIDTKVDSLQKQIIELKNTIDRIESKLNQKVIEPDKPITKSKPKQKPNNVILPDKANKTKEEKLQKAKDETYISEVKKKIENTKNEVEVTLSQVEIDEYNKKLYEYAETNLKAGKIEEAKEAYKKIIDTNPQGRYVPIAMKMLQKL